MRALYLLVLHISLNQHQASIDAAGTPLTDEALTAAKNADAVILGAIGGPVSSPSLGLRNYSD